MPYIEPEARTPINDAIDELLRSHHVTHEGELNYAITRLCHKYLDVAGRNDKLRYTHLNQIQGVLIGALLEFYAVVSRPYEDPKREENGPVSNYDKPA